MPSTTATASDEFYVLFDTAIGTMGIAWNAHGVRRVRLPEAEIKATERGVRGTSARRSPDRPPHIAPAIEALQRYTSGESIYFGFVNIDLPRVDAFRRRVYETARSVGFGQTLTYGELARRAGCEGEAQAVGQALARNPVPILVPCHRIVAAGQRLGGFSAPGGKFTKERLLTLEGVFAGAPVIAVRRVTPSANPPY